MKLKTLAIGLTAILALAGCKTRQGGEEPIRRGTEERLEAHRNSNSEFKTLVIKGKADFHDEAKKEDVSFSYKVSIARDSLILANISKLGLPAANIFITRDSVLMRLPLTKEAVRCDVDLLQEMTGLSVDFEEMQDLLVGNLIIPQKAELVDEKFVVKGPLGDQMSYTLGSNHPKLEKLELKEPKFDRELTLVYGKYKKSGGKWFPWEIELNRSAPSLTRIQLSHTDIEVDGEDTNFSFRIPDGYENKPCGSK